MRSIEVEGLHHGRAPIPVASQRGPIVVSSRIFGLEPDTGQLSAGDLQVEATFVNVERVLAAAGGGLANLVRLSLQLSDDGLRNAVDEAWLKRFPDPAARPARHIDIAPLRPPLVIQVEFIAYIAEDKS